MRHIFLLITTVLLHACAGPIQFTSALSEPGVTEFDERLLGAWYAIDDDNPIIFTIKDSRHPNMLDVTLYGEVGLEMTAYAAEFDGIVFYNIKADPESYKRAFPNDEESPHYHLLRIEFTDDDLLYLWGTSIMVMEGVNASGLTRYIEQGRIKNVRKVDSGDFSGYLLVEQTRDELQATIRDITPLEFLPVRFGPFSRLADPQDEYAINMWFFDEVTGCGVATDDDSEIAEFGWSGNCVDGKASGHGKLEWKYLDTKYERSHLDVDVYEGTMVDGKPHGEGRCRSGCVVETYPCRYDQGDLTYQPKLAGLPPVYKRFDALADMAAMQAHLGDAEEARRTIQEVRNLAASIPEQCMTTSRIQWVLSEVAHALAHLGDVSEAIAIAERLTGAQRGAWVEIADAQFQAGDLRGALTTADRAGDYRGKTLARISMNQAEMDDPVAAVEMAKRIAPEWAKQADYFAAKGEDRAWKIESQYWCSQWFAQNITKIKWPSPHWFSPKWLCHDLMYYMIALSQLETGDIDGAYNSVKHVLLSDYYRKCPVSIMQELAKQLAKTGDASAARRAYQLARILAAEEKPDHLSKIAIDQCDAGFIDDARETIKLRMDKTVIPEAHTEDLIRIAKALIKTSQKESALEIAHIVYRRTLQNPDEITYLGDIAAIQVAAGDIKAAEVSVKRLVEANNPEWFAKLAKVEAAIGNIKAAKARANRYEKGSKRAEALLEIAQIQKHNGDIKGSADTLLTVIYGDEEPYKYQLINSVNELIKLGEYKLAQSAAMTVKGVSDRIKVLNSIAASQYVGGEIVGAFGTIKHVGYELREQFQKSDAGESLHEFADDMNELIQEHVDVGNTFAKEQLFEIWQKINTADDASIRTKVLLDIAIAQDKFGDKHGARQTAIRAVNTAMKIPIGYGE